MTTLPLTLVVVLQLLGQEAPRSEDPTASEAPAAPARTPLATTPERVEPAPNPQPSNPPSTPPVLSRVKLKDGQVLRGFVLQKDEQHVVLELPDGNRMDLAARTVERVEEDPTARITERGEIRIMDPNRTRYFYAPSGLMLRQGESYFSQKELLFSSLNYGLTDHITLQAGSVLPALPVKGGLNFVAGLKVGGSVSDHLHLAVSAQALGLPGFFGFQAVGLLLGTATYGTPDAHVSLSMGMPVSLTNGSIFSDSSLFTLSGNVRVSQRVALVTENWLMPFSYNPYGKVNLLDSAGVRLFGEHWAVDLGLVYFPYVDFPVPWVDFTYNFGN